MDAVIQLAVRFLAQRDRTTAHVEQFLISRGVSPRLVEHAILRLSDLRYLDDYAYAQRWVSSRLASRPMGRERLKAELQGKGIDETVADQVIAAAFREVDEETVAQQALKGLQRKGRRLTQSQKVRFLHQRGFSEETIDRMLGESWTTEEPNP